jgi:methyl-accepting chemotaxis protein
MLHASNELAQVSADVSKTIDQQALQIEQISSAMTEMEATSVEVAHHAESTKASTLCATEQVLESKATIENAMNLISQLTISLESSSNNIKELETHSGQISSVLNVINGIADQTNLLALNAAIEAARAGEQGRGFAVVADEVRNLAKRTQESTIEVENMIGLFTRGTSEAVLSMAQSTIQGNSSKTATQDTNNIISDIQLAIHEINDMNDQIATAAEEQSCTTKELSRNTVSINQLSNDNLTSVSQISHASEELAQISMQLQEQLSQFTLS